MQRARACALELSGAAKLHVLIHNVAWERQKDVQTSDVAMYIQDTCQYFTITEENIVCPSYQQVLRRPLPRPRLFGILLLPGQSFLREQWQYGEGLGSSVQCRHGGGGGCERTRWDLENLFHRIGHWRSYRMIQNQEFSSCPVSTLCRYILARLDTVHCLLTRNELFSNVSR